MLQSQMHPEYHLKRLKQHLIVHPFPAVFHQAVHPVSPRRHDKTVGLLCKIPVKSGPDPHDRIRQKQNAQFHTVCPDREPVLPFAHLIRSRTYLHSLTLLFSCAPLPPKTGHAFRYLLRHRSSESIIRKWKRKS